MDTTAFTTTDPRVRRIGEDTWICNAGRHVFEYSPARGGVDVFNLRKGPGRSPALTDTPFATLDAAIERFLGPRPAAAA